jgi:hypothetical protein
MLKFQPINLNKRILVIHENGACCGELYCEVDGYYVYWPDESLQGCVSAEFLREIADKLDELNRPWDEEVKRGLEAAADD